MGRAPLPFPLINGDGNRRIKKAMEQLIRTNFPVRRIAEDLGFSDQNHFSALFKRKTGLSPLNYRKANR